MTNQETRPEWKPWSNEVLARYLEDLRDHIEDPLGIFPRRLLECARRLRAMPEPLNPEPGCAGCGSPDVRIFGDDYCSFECMDQHAAGEKREAMASPSEGDPLQLPDVDRGWNTRKRQVLRLAADVMGVQGYLPAKRVLEKILEEETRASDRPTAMKYREEKP